MITILGVSKGTPPLNNVPAMIQFCSLSYYCLYCCKQSHIEISCLIPVGLEEGVQDRDGAYAQDTLKQKVLPFLKRMFSVYRLLHSSMTSSNASRHWPPNSSSESGTDIFGNGEWLRNAFFLIMHI